MRKVCRRLPNMKKFVLFLCFFSILAIALSNPLIDSEAISSLLGQSGLGGRYRRGGVERISPLATASLIGEAGRKQRSARPIPPVVIATLKGGNDRKRRGAGPVSTAAIASLSDGGRYRRDAVEPKISLPAIVSFIESSRKRRSAGPTSTPISLAAISSLAGDSVRSRKDAVGPLSSHAIASLIDEAGPEKRNVGPVSPAAVTSLTGDSVRFQRGAVEPKISLSEIASISGAGRRRRSAEPTAPPISPAAILSLAGGADASGSGKKREIPPQLLAALASKL